MGSKYPLLLGVQMCMLLADFVFNAVSILMFANSTVLLMIYIIQDTLILLSVIVLMIAFTSTFVYQAGLIFLLFKRFSTTLIASLIYLAFSITLHCISLNIRWDNPTAPIYDTPHILILYIAQKYSAVIHYALYKRAALLMVDPKYHGDSEWLRNEIRKSS